MPEYIDGLLTSPIPRVHLAAVWCTDHASIRSSDRALRFRHLIQILLVAFLAAPVLTAASLAIYRLEVKTHADADRIQVEDVDRILRRAEVFLREACQVQGGCAVQFRWPSVHTSKQHEDIPEFHSPSAPSADMTAMQVNSFLRARLSDAARPNAPRASVYFVNHIEGCNPRKAPTKPTVTLGCSLVHGTATILALRPAPHDSQWIEIEAKVLAHEFAHLLGLRHVDAIGNLLHCFVDDSTKELTRQQCDVISGRTFLDANVNPKPKPARCESQVPLAGPPVGVTQ